MNTLYTMLKIKIKLDIITFILLYTANLQNLDFECGLKQNLKIP